MRAEVRIDNSVLRRVVSSLRKKMYKFDRVEAVVGYNTGIAPYAVYVHENLTAKRWTKAGTGPKFLEEPSRTYRDEICAAFFRTLRSTRSGVRAIYSAALVLFNRSQRVVPVKTGWLKSSAFITTREG